MNSALPRVIAAIGLCATGVVHAARALAIHGIARPWFGNAVTEGDCGQGWHVKGDAGLAPAPRK
jgi:hypothetical protein